MNLLILLLALQCPLQGNAKPARVKAANLLKNRTAIPSPADFDSTFTMDSVLTPGNDLQRWNEEKAGALIGWVHNVKPGGIESVNCSAKDIPHRDTHIELVPALDDSTGDRRVIVEVTPRLRLMMNARGIDWSTPTLKRTLIGKCVRIEGLIFSDFEHSNNAANTHPGYRLNWRATVIELHPVTKIEVLTQGDERCSTS